MRFWARWGRKNIDGAGGWLVVVVGLNGCRGNEGEVSWLRVVFYRRIFQNVLQHVCEGLVRFPEHSRHQTLITMLPQIIRTDIAFSAEANNLEIVKRILNRVICFWFFFFHSAMLSG